MSRSSIPKKQRYIYDAIALCERDSIGFSLTASITVSHTYGMTSKTFDCIEMKRRGAESVRKRLEGKSPAQKLEYWRKGTDELKKLQKQKQGKN